MSDVQTALDMFSVLCPESDDMIFLTIPGPPKSKARPRLGKGGRFYTPSSTDEKAVALQFRRVFPEPLQGNLAVGCIFYRHNRQRIDVDNMLKFIMDAANTIAFKDDSQVTAQFGIVEFDPDNPRTIFIVGRHGSTLSREPISRTCATCTSQFTVDCEARTQRYCSPTCRGAAIKQPKKRPGQGRGRKGQPPTLCSDCGTPVSKRSYVRCRPCWKTARSRGES